MELSIGEVGFDEVDPAPMGAFDRDSDGLCFLYKRVCPWIAGVGVRVNLDPVDGLSLGEIGR